MLDLLSLVMPLHLLILTGFSMVRLRLLPDGSIPAIGALVMNIALPALIINTLVGQNLREAFSLNYLLAYMLGATATVLLVFTLFLTILRRRWTVAFMAGFCSAMANSGFVGLPLVTLVLGASGLRAVPMTFLVENVVLIPTALALTEITDGSQSSARQVLMKMVKRLASSPILLAIGAGSALSALDVHLPAPVGKTIALLASAAVPCALIIIGAMLANTRPTAAGMDAIWITIGKLALHPLATFLAFLVIGNVPTDMRDAGIILASAPMATIVPLIGARFGLEGLTATALLTATVASFVTITIVLSLLAHA